MVAIRTTVLNLSSTTILQEKNCLKTSYKSYQMWRLMDLKIQSRIFSLEGDIFDVQYCCYMKLGAVKDDILVVSLTG